MKIMIDAYWWHRGPTSLQRVVRAIVQTWAATYPEDELHVVVRRPRAGEQYDRFPENVSVIETGVRPQAFVAAILIPMMAHRRGIGTVVTQNYGSAFGARAVLIHDFLFETNPEWFTLTERLYFKPMKHLARRAAVVLATSASEANRIREVVGPDVRTEVVGMGVGQELERQTARQPIGLAAGSFILTVGRINARKNLRRAIDSAANTGMLSPENPLVVVGERSGKSAILGPHLDALIANGSVRFLGFVDDDILKWLYENTRLFVFLSLGEGFGLPPIEAARLGAPVLVSDLSVFRETLGASGSFVDPTNSEAITEAIRAKISGEAQEIAVNRSQFDWVDVVRAIREFVR